MQTQGGRGVIKRSNFADVFYGWPLRVWLGLVGVRVMVKVRFRVQKDSGLGL